MRKIIFFILTFCSLTVFADSDSCECPRHECDPCHEQRGVTFYTDKCEGGSKVRSCAKPTCVVMEPASDACRGLAKKDQPASTVTAQTPKSGSTNSADVPQGKPIGIVAVVKGNVTVKNANGEVVTLNPGAPIHEQDTLQTTGNGQTQVKFNDGNTLHLPEGSSVKVKQYDVEDKKDKSAVFDLLKGKMRSQVQKKYDGKQSKFEVRTHSAVAGVRGTDFVISWTPGEKDVTKIETLEGDVRLRGAAAKEEASIKKGQSGSYIVEGSSSVFDEADVKEFVSKGYLTPVYEIAPEQLAKLDTATFVKEDGAQRTIASDSSKTKGETAICNAPKAPLNHCLWKCVNNPKGESRCRTDLPQVNCVRSRCNANGEWTEETRLPASFHGMCAGHEGTVAPCDY